MRRDTVGTLEDILTAARRILDRTHGQTLDAFRQDLDLRQIAERNFEISTGKCSSATISVPAASRPTTSTLKEAPRE